MIATKYLLISMENECAYTMAWDPVTANSLAASNINTHIWPVTKYAFEDFDKINRDFFRQKIYKMEFRDTKLSEVDPSIISQEWKDERDAMHFRQDGHGLLEIHYLTATAPLERSHWGEFSNQAWEEIMLCEPENNFYTRYIQEYARILDQPVDEIYKELRLKIEGEKFVRFRISALVERWKIKINQIRDKEDFDKVKAGMFNEFWRKSQI